MAVPSGSGSGDGGASKVMCLSRCTNQLALYRLKMGIIVGRLTVSTHHCVSPLESTKLFQDVPDPRSAISNLDFFSSPPDAARIIRAQLVTMTSLCLFLVVCEDMKNLENLRGASWLDGSPFLACVLAGSGETVTIRLPNLRMRSLALVSTGDHSRSS
jgi:hypothetical protein